MKPRWKVMTLMLSGQLALLNFACLADPTATAPSGNDNASLCVSNMIKLCLLLKTWTLDRERYPPNLSYVANKTNLDLFVCPGIGSRPGKPKDVSEWTDFLYVGGGVEDAETRIPLLLSPPEDHEGQFGLVVWSGGGWSRVAPARFRAVVEAPWSIQYSPADPSVKFIKEDITVHVPKRFRQLYPKAYSAPAKSSADH
jgi:hypothetical protein